MNKKPRAEIDMGPGDHVFLIVKYVMGATQQSIRYRVEAKEYGHIHTKEVQDE